MFAYQQYRTLKFALYVCNISMSTFIISSANLDPLPECKGMCWISRSLKKLIDSDNERSFFSRFVRLLRFSLNEWPAVLMNGRMVSLRSLTAFLKSVLAVRRWKLVAVAEAVVTGRRHRWLWQRVSVVIAATICTLSHTRSICHGIIVSRTHPYHPGQH